MGGDEDEEFDSFDEDNLEELIKLTARPSNTQAKPVTQVDQSIELQLQSAHGENAILRSKLELLEKEKAKEVHKLKEQYNIELNDKVAKIQSFQELAVRLEDEKKFLKSELSSLSTRSKANKRRKIDEVRHDDTQVSTQRRKPDIESSDVAMILDDDSSTSTTTPSTTFESTLKLTQPALLPNEKQLFIDTIYIHVINGANDTTLNFLTRIKSPIDFKHERFEISSNHIISTSILNYLLQLNSSIRLDNLISEFIEILTIYIQKLYLNDSPLAIPFLLSMVHCTLNYRPSALQNDVIEQLLLFNSDLLRNYLHILRSAAVSGQELHSQETRKNFQFVMLDQLIVIFSMDIMELLSKLSFTKNDLIKTFWKALPKDLVKSGVSNTTCVNCVFNVIEILTSCATSLLDEKEEELDDEESFVKDDDILLSMTKLLIDGMPLVEGFRIYGLNRILGNNDDLILLEKMIHEDGAKDGHKPLPILTDDLCKITLKNRLDHEIHSFNLKLKILRFFETFFMHNAITSLKFDLVIEMLKIFIWVLLIQQEYIIRNPRSETVYMRNLMINTLVKLIHFIVLKNGEIPQDQILQKISNDVSYNFVIALARISFSSDTNLTQLSWSFLSKIDKNFEIPIFNKSVEEMSYLNNNVSQSSSSLNLKILTVLNNNNGLEISFDDDIIEMSRDLIELYTTAIELDNLYFAMNKVTESNEIDELMMEYLNENIRKD